MIADYIFAIGSLILTLGVLPMVRHEHKPPLLASVPVLLVLSVFACTYAAIGFHLAALVEAVQAGLWGTLVWQAW